MTGSGLLHLVLNDGETRKHYFPMKEERSKENEDVFVPKGALWRIETCLYHLTVVFKMEEVFDWENIQLVAGS
jgi:hypothetical protein